MEALKQFIVRLIETNIVEFGPRKVKQFIDRYKNKENDIRNLKKEDFTYVMKIATSYKMKKELKDIKILWKRWLLYNIGDAFYSHHSAEKESMKEWIQLNKKLKTRNSSYMFPTILAGYGTHKLDDEDVGINPVEAIYYETADVLDKIRRKQQLDERDKFVYSVAKDLTANILEDVKQDRETIQAFKDKWGDYSPQLYAMRKWGYTSQLFYNVARFFKELSEK